MNKTEQLITAQNIEEALSEGNPNALAFLYDNYSGALYGVLLKMLSDAELCQDLLQESFIKIWKNAQKFDPEKASLYTWMLNITRNNAIDYLRSKRNKNAQKNRGMENVVYALESRQKFNPSHIGLNQLVKQLPEDQRQIIQLSYFEGYTQQEISEEFEIPLGTVKSRGRAALQKLKKLFNR